MPIIRAASGLHPGQEREAWNWRAHALRRGDKPLGLFVFMMKNPGKPREVTAADEEQGRLDMKAAELLRQKPPALSPKERYQQFRKTWLWQKVRLAALRRARFTCGHCGKRTVRSELEVHHKDYSRPWGKERPESLIVLCHRCHQRAHGRPAGTNIAEIIDGFFRRVEGDE